VLKPDFADAYLSLGDALREQGDPDEAAAHFHKAIALKPDCAGAYIGLSSLCQDSGQFAAAGSYLEQALALSPDHPVACAAQPYLRKMTEEDAAWLEKACGIIKEGLKPQDEMKLAYALGKYHDDTRQYEAAFGYYERANRLKKLSSPPFDRKDFSRLIDAIISIHDMEVMRRRHAGSSTSARPLLIVGMPRSGTSLTEQILASHPDVAGAGELRFWGQQAQAQHSVMRSWHRDAHLLQSLAARYEAELLRHSPDALRVVDKMPGNFLYLGLIHAVFPEARFLHTQRNPIDTCLSIYFQDFPRQHHYANDLDDLAFYYREYHRLMAHWRRVLPPEVFLDVPYEALVEDQEGWSRRIAGFAGLEWSERCLRFHETERRVGTASNWQVRQKIYRTSRERWRSYERFAGPLLPLLELDRH
jgi:tetratricopeptide (TPR) repeat protein